MDELTEIRDEIRNHASNAWAMERGYEPISSASPRSKVVVIGQAPGKAAQDSQVPWNDQRHQTAAVAGRHRGAVLHSDTIALLPMDFYYPGKGTHGDLSPRLLRHCGIRESSS